VAEQFLDLAQVGAGAQQFGGEHVPERVRSDALVARYAGRTRVAAEGLAEYRDREPDGAAVMRDSRRFARLSRARRQCDRAADSAARTAVLTAAGSAVWGAKNSVPPANCGFLRARTEFWHPTPTRRRAVAASGPAAIGTRLTRPIHPALIPPG
jgi:hypothetical protein